MSAKATPPTGTQPANLPVTILAQYIKDLSFENPHIVKSLAEQRSTPKMNINIQVQANQAGEKVFEISLHVQAEAKYEKETAFIIDLTYAGLFGVEETDKEVLKPFLLIECPRLLFPFARNIVAEVSREGGMPPLMLNPVDFAQLYDQQGEQAPKESVN